MPYAELAPHPALRPFVDRLWTSVSEGDPGPRRILPDGCIDLLLDGHDGGRGTIVGTMTRAAVFDPGGPVRLVAVRFRPGGAAPFLGIPADALTDRNVDFGQAGLHWLESAQRGPFEDIGQAARALEGGLLARLQAARRPDALVGAAVASLLSTGSPSVEQLSQGLGCSRQRLRRAFQRHVGIGPKHLARVARMQRAIELLQRGSRAGLAATAVDLGYFDQAHLARDLRELAGVTPRVARASAGSIFPILSLFDEAHPRV